MHKERTVKETILNISDSFKVVLLTGMRQIGKTTLLKHLSKNRKYVTLDDKDDLRLAKQEPKLFFEQYKPPVLIDEVQYAPELFPYIKILADNSDARGSIWLSGSQQFLMMKNVSESLAGRVGLVDMLGFSIYEQEEKASMQIPFLPSNKPASQLRRKTMADTYKIIWRGFFPDIDLHGDSKWEAFYKSYLKTYIERDVRALLNVGDEFKFETFLNVVAARTGQELNLTDIAKDAGISQTTATRWISVLRASGIVYLLRPWHKNIGKRIVKTPKIYFTDTGLCSYLTGWKTPETLERGAMSGAIFETFVIVEILKSYIHNGFEPRFYFYRDSNRVEIDLLISQNGLLYPVEIKRTMHPHKNDIAAFSTLGKKEKLGYGSLICMTDKPQLLTSEANAISVWDI